MQALIFAHIVPFGQPGQARKQEGDWSFVAWQAGLAKEGEEVGKTKTGEKDKRLEPKVSFKTVAEDLLKMVLCPQVLNEHSIR